MNTCCVRSSGENAILNSCVKNLSRLTGKDATVTCWIVTREVNSSNPICVCFLCLVFFLTAFSFSDKKPFSFYGKVVFVFLFLGLKENPLDRF